MLSHDVATKKFAFGLNFKQLTVSEGGCDTSISLFGLVAVVFDVEPKEKPLPALLAEKNDIFFKSKMRIKSTFAIIFNYNTVGLSCNVMVMQKAKLGKILEENKRFIQ